MGEVYRAHDPRIRRDVAIKIPSWSYAADSERLERFRREARAAGGPDGRWVAIKTNGGIRLHSMRGEDARNRAGCLPRLHMTGWSEDGRSYAYTALQFLSDLFLVDGLW